jgi:hypothetical protein
MLATRRSLVGAFGTLWRFLEDFLFSSAPHEETKRQGLGEVASTGWSSLARAQSLWVLRACCFLGEGPSIDTVPSPSLCGVQKKINGLHAIQYHAEAEALLVL